MSSQRGNGNRSRSQKYKNTTAFKNNLHDTSGKQKLINSLNFEDTCERCTQILQWKVKYRKYKPLTQPKVCAKCNEKTVRLAYRVLCQKCADSETVCPKCCKSFNTEKTIENTTHVQSISELSLDLQKIVQTLPERRRRTFERLVCKGKFLGDAEETDRNGKKGLKSYWTEEELTAHLEELSLRKKSDSSDDDYFSDEDEENEDQSKYSSISDFT